ncbi:MAG: uroporphyrinogen-III synthase, partial [Geminicoccales bacterium]
VYDTVRPGRLPDEARARIERGGVDALTFASPSALRNYIELAGNQLLRSRPVVCIGETTAGAAREAGVPEPVIAPRPSTGGLIDALLEYGAGTRQEASTHG